MDAVKSTIKDAADILSNLDFHLNKSITQDPNRLIRHSKISDFNVEAVNNFYMKKFNMENLKFRTYLNGEK